MNTFTAQHPDPHPDQPHPNPLKCNVCVGQFLSCRNLYAGQCVSRNRRRRCRNKCMLMNERFIDCDTNTHRERRELTMPPNIHARVKCTQSHIHVACVFLWVCGHVNDHQQESPLLLHTAQTTHHHNNNDDDDDAVAGEPTHFTNALVLEPINTNTQLACI